MPERMPRRRPDGSLTFDAGTMVLDVWRIGEDPAGRQRYAYRFSDPYWDRSDPVVFEGTDFSTGLGREFPPRKIALEVAEFLAMEAGDVEADYFEWYSPRQLAWRDARANALKQDVEGLLQEEASRREPRERRRRKQDWNPRKPL